MFFPKPKWPILFWNIFSVNSLDLNYRKWQIVYSVILMTSCVYNFLVTPKIICMLEGGCDSALSTVIKGLFARVVASTCFASRLSILLKGKNQLVTYKKNIDLFHTLTPMDHSETERLKKISSLVVLLCILLTTPFNVLRISSLIRTNFAIPCFFLLMYIQNISMCFIESHFIFLCFVLYQKFAAINQDLMALKVDTILRNKYPFTSQIEEKFGESKNNDNHSKEILHYLIAACPMTSCIEQLKIKHRFLRESVRNLNDLFGVHLGLSMCSLCLYAMFDLYYHIMGIMNPSKSGVLIYGWILQYTFRFGAVTILAHLTMKQALRSKILVSDINNHRLDANTKEELQLFLNQISSCSIEFTACDFFTLNTHLITSAIAAGTTYLVILLQFNTTKD